MIRSGLTVQLATVKALFFREIRTRFGKYRLGYLWAILEPAAHLFILLAIFRFIVSRTMTDISFPVFLLNGIIPYLLFSSIVKRSLKAIEANQGLFNYRPVKPVDTVIARVLLETTIYAFVYVFLMLVMFFCDELTSIHNILLLFAIWCALVLLSSGTGMLFMVTGKLYPETEKYLPIMLKPLYFISCIMYPLHAITVDYSKYLLWNPIVHIVELSRKAVVYGYVSEGADIIYLEFVSLAVFFIGLAVCQISEDRMLTS